MPGAFQEQLEWGRRRAGEDREGTRDLSGGRGGHHKNLAVHVDEKPLEGFGQSRDRMVL